MGHARLPFMRPRGGRLIGAKRMTKREYCNNSNHLLLNSTRVGMPRDGGNLAFWVSEDGDKLSGGFEGLADAASGFVLEQVYSAMEQRIYSALLWFEDRILELLSGGRYFHLVTVHRGCLGHPKILSDFEDKSFLVTRTKEPRKPMP